MTISGRLVVSVVSHGHGRCVIELLEDLARFSASTVRRVVLTLNLVDEVMPVQERSWPFVLEIRRNQSALGYGENHNRALASAKEEFVCVLNPDIRLREDPFAALVATAGRKGVGCAYPLQLDESGHVQDSERALPTPLALWHRRVLKQGEQRVDWVNGACLVLPTGVWRQLKGFDERYFMYCEDVDLSLRVRLAGLLLERAPTEVIHAAQRASGRSVKHFLWHVASLLRLWSSPAYKQARKLAPMPLPARRQGGQRP